MLCVSRTFLDWRSQVQGCGKAGAGARSLTTDLDQGQTATERRAERRGRETPGPGPGAHISWCRADTGGAWVTPARPPLITSPQAPELETLAVEVVTWQPRVPGRGLFLARAPLLEYSIPRVSDPSLRLNLLRHGRAIEDTGGWHLLMAGDTRCCDTG